MTREERGGDFRGKGWRVCRNNYKRHMDKNNGGWKWEGGRDGQVGGEGWGGKAENDLNNNKKNVFF